MRSELTEAYLAILREELLPAVGCTEPIALAYAAAVLKRTLGKTPERIKASVSGNILKNVKSAVVPHTAGMHGIPAAIAAGITAGNPDAGLEVLAQAGDCSERCAAYLTDVPVEICCLDSGIPLDILLEGICGCDTASVRITGSHTGISFLQKNGKVLIENRMTLEGNADKTDRSILSLRKIVEFSECTPLPLLRQVFRPQQQMNEAIAEEGMREHWGSSIGRHMLKLDSSAAGQAAAYAAAASDARMSGCPMPVMILSGSGNQGLTASVPVTCYGRLTNCTEEQIIRALAVASLTAIHLKTGIGRLSAYCGAVSAGCGAGAGIAWLRGGTKTGIEKTVSNALGILSGTICDGAKPSCAAKIAMAVRAGILGYEMVLSGDSFRPGDGIIGRTPEETVTNAGIVAREGMQKTDGVILDIMLGRYSASEGVAHGN